MLGPRAPTSMARFPDAMLTTSMGIRKGLTRDGPFSSRIWYWVSQVAMPPMPEHTQVPMRSALAAISRPDSRMASRPAAIAIWQKRSIRRADLGSRTAAGSKSQASAAIRTSYSCASNRVMYPAPDTPSHRPLHVSAVLAPRGLTTPTPVTTTRRFTASLSALGSCGAPHESAPQPHLQTRPGPMDSAWSTRVLWQQPRRAHAR